MPGHVKKTRARRMRELGARKKNEFCAGFVGRRVSVLIEEKVEKQTGLRRGFSRNYLPVAVAGADDFLNRELNVRIDRYSGDWLNGVASQDSNAFMRPAQ